MAQTQKKQQDMGTGDVKKLLLQLMIPAVVAQVVNLLYNIVDRIYIGHISGIGAAALTGVGLFTPILMLLNAFAMLIGSGGAPRTAIAMGQGDKKQAEKIVSNSFTMLLLFSVVLTIVFYAAAPTLLRLFGASDTTLPYALVYSRIYILGTICVLIVLGMNTFITAQGFAKISMLTTVIGAVINIVLDPILIFGLGMGVKGAAIATVLARVAEMGIVVIWAHACRKKHVFLQGIYRTFRVPKQLAQKVVRKGLPIFFNEFLWAGGIAALTQCYSTRGLEIVAGLNISNALCNLLNVVFVALGSAVGILIGQTLGASMYEKAKKDAFHLMWFTGAVSLGLTVILVCVSGVFPKLYDTTAQVQQYGQWFIVITALFFPVQGFLNALYFTLRSGGKTMVTFLFDSVYTWLIPVPMALLLCHLTALPILAVYAIVQAADLIKVLVGYVLIRRGVWISNLVEEV